VASIPILFYYYFLLLLLFHPFNSLVIGIFAYVDLLFCFVREPSIADINQTINQFNSTRSLTRANARVI